MYVFSKPNDDKYMYCRGLMTDLIYVQTYVVIECNKTTIRNKSQFIFI